MVARHVAERVARGLADAFSVHSDVRDAEILQRRELDGAASAVEHLDLSVRTLITAV